MILNKKTVEKGVLRLLLTAVFTLVMLTAPGGNLFTQADAEQEDVLVVFAPDAEEITPSYEGTGVFMMPTEGRFSSPYGRRWGRFHHGIDLSASVGTPVYAADNGIVTVSNYNKNGYGNLIEIDHQNGMVTRYAHLNSRAVSEGDGVLKGDLLGTVGNTGRSTGPHLHFEVRIEGKSKDPMAYLKSE